MHRLTKVDYNRSATTGDEVYVYDALGNRVTYTDQRNATTRTYANNVANEYTSVAAYAVTHDAAGNLSKQTVNGDGDAYVYAYDCDNRLLGVTFDEAGVGATPLATFAYDALGRKITAWTTALLTRTLSISPVPTTVSSSPPPSSESVSGAGAHRQSCVHLAFLALRFYTTRPRVRATQQHSTAHDGRDVDESTGSLLRSPLISETPTRPRG
ncbi:MAG: hypothetical protein FLDDKLPJ_03053 [Phycisphaerae bacterium]|nr:hypothetical protein [Phycisphaerae bacterium]